MEQKRTQSQVVKHKKLKLLITTLFWYTTWFEPDESLVSADLIFVLGIWYHEQKVTKLYLTKSVSNCTLVTDTKTSTILNDKICCLYEDIIILLLGVASSIYQILTAKFYQFHVNIDKDLNPSYTMYLRVVDIFPTDFTPDIRSIEWSGQWIEV